ncbi:MAG TPA: DNA-3-methyladenine glycosylase [Gemmatimonadaceae bacterium]|nr:DNA-3-methyladenine glycosylase [Gemmatimonadaceae bacterium]
MTENAAPQPRARRSRLGPALPAAFYDRDTEHVARELLGAVLVCESEDGVASGRIVETEAYLGAHDPACHAVAGRTDRTWWLFGPPGVAYIYFIYGAHWCFNAVTREEGHGSAVLVRALEPLEGVELMRRRRPRARREVDLTNGPGKLCAALGITGALDGVPLQRPPLSIHRGEPVPDDLVRVSPRIGITQAAAWPLRWHVADSPYVSPARPAAPRHRRRR